MGSDGAEVERLRELVGPSERSYQGLLTDVEGAQDAARDAEHRAGELRGEIAELRVQLARARQDQDTFQRRREMGPGAYLGDVARECWSEVVRPAVGRVARTVGLRRSS